MNLKTNRSARKRRKSLESFEQQRFFGWLSHYPIIRRLTFAIPNGGSRSKKEIMTKFGEKKFISPEGIRFKKEGVTAGIPDIIMFIPVEPYHALLIENKTQTGKLTDSQKEFINNVTPLGYKCVIAHNWLEGRQHVLDYLKTDSLLEFSKNLYK